MALEDYNIDLYYVEKQREPDGTGGFEYVYKIGAKFSGTAKKASTSEQTVAGVRGVVGEQYAITTAVNNVLLKDDIIMLLTRDRERVFLRINSNLEVPPEQSEQSYWKYGTATLFNPDLRVVD